MAQNEIVYGIHAVNAVINRYPHKIKNLFVSRERDDERIKQLLVEANQMGIFVEFVTQETLAAKANSSQHQGVVALCQSLPRYSANDLWPLLENLQRPPFLLILDNVQDPHNLGACLRSAECAGCDAVIIPKHHCVNLTPVVRKVASGAAETVPLITVTNLAQTIAKCRDYNIWFYGLSERATTSIYDCEFSHGVAMILGQEGKGMRSLTEKHCDELLSIPINGNVSSLNVSVACGIALYEVVRQHGKTQA